MNGVSLKDRLTSKELRENLQIENIAEVVRRARLRWFAHVERKDDEDWVKRTTRLEIEGSRPAGSLRRPGMRQSKLILGGLDSTQVKPCSNREAWRQAIHAAGSNPGAPGKRTRKR